MSRPPSGIFLLDKPSGMSSNAALQRVKRLFGASKAGHTGSLDPLASGMLPVCLGEATKVAGALLDAHKHYRFVVRLGSRTASGDLEEEVIERREVPSLGAEAVTSALGAFVGPRSQVPPMHSAIKQGGKRLYELARRGLEVDRAARAIEIVSLELETWATPDLTLLAVCSKGTYIRVLAEEVAAALGTCGHVTLLHRVWTSPFEKDTAVAFDRLEAADLAERESWLLPIDHALQHWPRVDLGEGDADRIGHGQVLNLDRSEGGSAGPTPVRLYGPGSRFLGLGEWTEGGRLAPKRLLMAADSPSA